MAKKETPELVEEQTEEAPVEEDKGEEIEETETEDEEEIKTPPLKKYAGTFGSVEELEEAYSRSSSEGTRLGQVVKTFREMVQKDPLLKERLQQHLGLEEDVAPKQESGIPPEDRAILDQMKAEQEKKNKEIWFKFVEQNPTFEKPEMVTRLEELIPAIVEGGRRAGKSYTFDEILNISANIINPASNTRNYMSEDGITTGSASTKTFKAKSETPLSDEEREMATSLGLTEKEYTEGKKLKI